MNRFLRQITAALLLLLLAIAVGQTLAADAPKADAPKAVQQSGQATVAKAGSAQADVAAAERLFVRDIWPVFQAKCLACHGGDGKEEPKGAYSIASREALLRGGESGEPSVIPGDPEASPLYQAIRWELLEMPPKENDRLTPEQIAAVRTWITAGAPWPEGERFDQLKEEAKWDTAGGVTVATSGGLADDWTNRRYKPEDLWAYQPLSEPTVPALPAAFSGGTAIDAFIAAKLAAKNITPAPPADRRTLLRRVTYDLTGLPPTPAEVAAFLADTAPDEVAFAKVVDRLLASPHYGEHWGRHWLDVTRYADSSGFANDYDRGNAWRYRDYVIRSFNADKPYADFVREQIAGDELDPNDPEMLVAVGFLRMGPWELTGMEVAKVARQRFLDDVTDTVGQVFLSHPLQCAKCHDHKFDPIPTRDYYRIQAAFATTQLTEREADFLPVENRHRFDERALLLRKQKEYQAELARIDAKEEAAAKAWAKERNLPYIPRRQAVRNGVPESQIAPKGYGLEPMDFGLERISRKGLERLRWQLDRYEPVALSVYNGLTPDRKSVMAPYRIPEDHLTAGELEQTAILTGGDPFSPSQPVSPGAISALNSSCKGLPSDELTDGIAGRRTELADWIASPHNALAARSIVNRLWQWHFNRGLVTSPNNFGATGNKPTHPELLDWLAVSFLEQRGLEQRGPEQSGLKQSGLTQGGSIKSLHRLILLSETYRRSSQHPDPKAVREADPLGELYASFPPRRLTAEEMRDAMLRVSGELNPEIGGIPVRPEMNEEAALQPRQVMGTFAQAWEPSPLPSDRHRRSLYALQLRGLRDPLMETFNQPGPDTPCEGRDASTITPQVFALFNGGSIQDRSLAFAARVLQETASREEAIRRAFALAFQRAPSDTELAACLAHWRLLEQRHTAVAPEPTERPAAVLREAVEENTGEKFTFTENLYGSEQFVPDLKPWDTDAKTRALADVCLILLNANEFVYLD